MAILLKHIDFVNDQASRQGGLAARYAYMPERQQRHLETQSQLQALAQDLLEAERLLEAKSQIPSSNTSTNPFILTPRDIDGLPEELIAELSLSDADRTEFVILGLVDEAGGVLTLDKILIGLYKRTKEIVKRVNMTSRLYRMCQKGLLFNVPGRKGCYSTRQLTEEEAANLNITPPVEDPQ